MISPTSPNYLSLNLKEQIWPTYKELLAIGNKEKKLMAKKRTGCKGSFAVQTLTDKVFITNIQESLHRVTPMRGMKSLVSSPYDDRSLCCKGLCNHIFSQNR